MLNYDGEQGKHQQVSIVIVSSSSQIIDLYGGIQSPKICPPKFSIIFP